MMNFRFWTTVCVLVFVLVLGHGFGHGAMARAGVKHVVIIGVDGLSGPGIDAASTPRMNELIRSGSYTFRARGVMPTSSAANWASIVTGAQPEHHGVTGNDWERDANTIVPATMGSDEIFPTIFHELRRQHPEAKIAVIYDWDGFGKLFEAGACDFAKHISGAEAATKQACETIREMKPTLAFVHLDHVDHAGHAVGWETPGYLQSVTLADTYIGQIVDAYKSAGIWESTALIITSDHGGVGKSHGGESMRELQIPWIITGPGIAKSRRIDAPVYTTDTAATVAKLLNFKLSSATIGRPVLAAMEETADAEGVGATTAYVPTPAIVPPGGRWVDGIPAIAITSEFGDAVIRYTTDGTTPTQNSPVVSGKIELQSTSTVTARLFTRDGASEPTSYEFRRVVPEQGKGVAYELFVGEYRQLPDFSKLTPARTGIAKEFDVSDVASPREAFAVRYRANIELAKSGKYRFWCESDDGSRLLIDGKELIDNDGAHGPKTRGGQRELSAGAHLIEVRYFNEGGAGSLRVFIAEPDGKRRLLEHGELRPPATAPTSQRIAIIGDYGTDSSMQAEVAERVAAMKPDFVCTTGDNTYLSASVEDWDRTQGKYYGAFIEYPAGSASKYAGNGVKENRFFPVAGNHDWDAGIESYLGYFALPREPSGGRYYRVRKQDVELFMLSADEREPDGREAGSKQYEWAKAAVKSSDAKWKFVFFHQPAWTAVTKHAPEKKMRWPFKEWGVSAVFMGHNHNMQRIDVDGLPCFVIGSSGKERYEITGPPDEGELKFSNDEALGLLLLEVNGASARASFVDANGKVLDTHAIPAAPTPASPGQ